MTQARWGRAARCRATRLHQQVRAPGLSPTGIGVTITPACQCPPHPRAPQSRQRVGDPGSRAGVTIPCRPRLRTHRKSFSIPPRPHWRSSTRICPLVYRSPGASRKSQIWESSSTATWRLLVIPTPPVRVSEPARVSQEEGGERSVLQWSRMHCISRHALGRGAVAHTIPDECSPPVWLVLPAARAGLRRATSSPPCMTKLLCLLGS